MFICNLSQSCIFSSYSVRSLVSTCLFRVYDSFGIKVCLIRDVPKTKTPEKLDAILFDNASFSAPSDHDKTIVL